MKQKIKLPSNRNFGIVFSIVFLIISLWPLLSQNEIKIWSLVLSGIFHHTFSPNVNIIEDNGYWGKSKFVTNSLGFKDKINRQISLKLKNEYKKRVIFIGDSFTEGVLEDKFFDFIWCNGVLHHTKNPYEGFKITLKSLKKEGYILVGLYNKIGRIRTKVRAYFYKIFGKKLIMKLDPILRNLKSDSEDQINAWIQDQYIHPVESCHTIDEVLNWFDQNDVEFISSIPKTNFEETDFEKIFEKKDKGSFLSRLINQILMIFTNLGSDGGLFVVVGKKK